MSHLLRILDKDSLFYVSYIIAILFWVFLLPILARYYIIIGWDMRPRVLMLSVPIYIAINIVATIIYYLKVTKAGKIESIFLGLLGGILVVVSIEMVLFVLGVDVMVVEFLLATLQISVVALAAYELATRIKKRNF